VRAGVTGAVCAGLIDGRGFVRTAADTGMISSHFSSPPAIQTSHILGRSPTSRRRWLAPGSSTPAAIASLIRRRNRWRRMKDRTTMAHDTARSKSRVARKVYKYSDEEVDGERPGDD